MPLANGTRLGPYEIMAPLGAGGMGEVYKARDSRLDRDVAVKVLPPALAAQAGFRERFDREARTISRLTHPHICTIHDVGRDANVAYLVMEYLEGDTLGQWARRAARPGIDAIVDVALQISQALAAAHAAGVVHRDVKPDNVVVSRSGFVKVLDFGVAKLLDHPEVEAVTVAPSHTAAGLVVGTTKYMSPEQARGLPVDARSDVFSFGILLYELLAGRAPFEASTATDTVVAILERQPPPLADQRADVPAALQRIVMTCLEKDVERRYPSAGDLVRELERVKGETSGRPVAAKSAPSIAVLPFVNMSNDPENEYFCDGIAEDLIGALTKIDQLHVAARTSAFSFKGKNADLKDVGRTLNVGTVLEGSVRKAGNRLRITAQLVNVADGYQLWSERYDRQLEDVFEIQDEISAAIVKALKVRLLGEEKGAAVKRHTDNIEAYQAYLKGRHHWHKWTAAEFAKSKECMERAIAIDPDYALAYFGIADVYLASGAMGLIPHGELLPKAKSALNRALDLDPDLAEAWTLMGVVHFFEWEWTASERASTRAIDLNPRLGHAYVVRALNSIYSGASGSGLEDAKRAVELDPLAALWNYTLVMSYVARHEDEAALRYTAALLDIDPGFWWGHYQRGCLTMARGEWREASQCFAEAVRFSGGAPFAVGLLASALALSGERERGERELVALLERAKEGYVPALGIALAYLGVGPTDRLFEWLERSFEERDTMLLFHLLYDRQFDRLRRDPRMIDLRRRLAQAGVRLDVE